MILRIQHQKSAWSRLGPCFSLPALGTELWCRETSRISHDHQPSRSLSYSGEPIAGIVNPVFGRLFHLSRTKPYLEFGILSFPKEEQRRQQEAGQARNGCIETACLRVCVWGTSLRCHFLSQSHLLSPILAHQEALGSGGLGNAHGG